MDSKKIKFSAFLVQGLATVAIASLATLTGIAFAWPSYTTANFISNETVLSHPMSPVELSLLGSLPNIGGLVATPFTEYAVNKFGRKYAAVLFGLPFVLSWSIIILSSNVTLVIAAVSLSGFGAAGQAISSVYIGEIAQESIRGGLSSSLVAALFVGLLISYILGGYLSYNMVLYSILSICILYIVSVMMLKESPVFLVQKGMFEEAAKSLAFYRRVDPTSVEVQIEINKIILQLDSGSAQKSIKEADPASEELLTMKPMPVPAKEKTESSWKFLLKSESSKRALGASLFLMISNTLMGAIVLQVYSEPLFEKAVPSMSPNFCSIITALVFLSSVVSCAMIVDRFGRKFLMTTTSLASGVCTALIGTQLLLHFAPHYFTAIFIYAFCYVNYLGAATVPFIFMAEVFLPEVRGLGNSLTMAAYFFTNFVELMVFNPLLNAFGLGPLFYGFSTVCFLTAIYSQFCLPETKGLTADEIQLLFLKKKKNERSNDREIGFNIC